MTEKNDRPTKADQYRFADGTTEVVFAIEDGRVLSFREYPDVETFEEAVESAQFEGVHRGVEELPDASAFRDVDERRDE